MIKRVGKKDIEYISLYYYAIEKGHRLPLISKLTGINPDVFHNLSWCFRCCEAPWFKEYSEAYDYRYENSMTKNEVVDAFGLDRNKFKRCEEYYRLHEKIEFMRSNDLFITFNNDDEVIEMFKDRPSSPKVKRRIGSSGAIKKPSNISKGSKLSFEQVEEKPDSGEIDNDNEVFVKQDVGLPSTINKIIVNDIELNVPSDKVCDELLINLIKAGLK